MYVEEKKLGEPEILDEVGKILLDAADYIERKGWCQRVNSNIGGEVCAWGAIAIVLEVSPDFHVLTHTEQRALVKLVDYLGGGVRLVGEIVRWNDTPGRTKEQVVAALRAAARS